MKLPIKIVATVAALAILVGLTACDPSPIVGPTGAPLVVVTSTENPTTDLLTDYRRSITVVDDANLFDTFDKAKDLADQYHALVLSKEWYDSLYDPAFPAIPVSEQARSRVQDFLSVTGGVDMLCNHLYVDTSIPTVGRQAIYDEVARYAADGLYAFGPAWQYRTYSADPGNELVTGADACFAEGV